MLKFYSSTIETYTSRKAKESESKQAITVVLVMKDFIPTY